jgi:hypothetical protein
MKKPKRRSGSTATTATISPIIPRAQADTGTGPFLAWSNGYQAGDNSPNRGYLIWPTTDTRRQMTSLTRSEILRRIQWLYAHFGFCRRLVNGMARLCGYVVPQPNTSDDEWNDMAYDAIMSTMGNAIVWDIQGKFDGLIGQVQDNITIFRDGYALCVLTETPTGRARTAYYEAHQIKSPPDAGPEWVEGVKLNRTAAPIAYCVQDGEDREKFTIVDARDAIYFGNYENRGQVHALSVLVPAVLNMIDVIETRGSIKASIKNHSRLGTVIEKDAPNVYNPTGGFGGPVQTVTATMPDGTEQKLNFEIATAGVTKIPLQPGERVKVISDDRPSQNFMDFERQLLTDCCHGADLDYQTLCDISSVTGPGIRSLNAALKRWTLLRRYPQIKRVHRLTVWTLAKEMKSGRLRAPILRKGEQWWSSIVYIGLADMDIDGGRTAQATLSDLRSGQTTWLDLHGARGIFWKKAISQAINEMVYAQLQCLKAAENAGLPPDSITPERVFPDRFTGKLPVPPANPDEANYDADTSSPADPSESSE